MTEIQEQGEKLQPKVCDWCSPSQDPYGLKIGKGKFRDVDSDFLYGIPICGGCGGLGVQYSIEDFGKRTERILELRFKYCPADEKERESLTEIDKLATLKSLESEVKQLVEKYGDSSTEDSFANQIAKGILTDVITETEKRAERIKEIRDSKADAVRTALKEPAIAYIEGRHDAAEKGFKEAINKFPESSFVYHDYGVFLAQAKDDLSGAYINFVKSLDLEPKKTIHAYQAGKCALMLEKYDEAIKWLEVASQMPDSQEFESGQEINISQIIKELKGSLKKNRSIESAVGQTKKIEVPADKLFTKMSEDLCEIAIKWGARIKDQDKVIFHTKKFGLDFEATIYTTNRPDNQTVIVRKGTDSGGYHKIPSTEDTILPVKARTINKETPGGIVYPQAKEEGAIILDNRLSVEDLFNMIILIDREAAEKGLIDEKGKRISHPELNYADIQKYKVDEVFIEEGIALPVMEWEDPETIIKGFDKPEELTTRTDPWTTETIAIVHKRDLAYLEKRDKVLNDILIERNLTVGDIIGGLERDPKLFTPMIVAIRQEVEERMKKKT